MVKAEKSGLTRAVQELKQEYPAVVRLANEGLTRARQPSKQ